jgi:ribosomal protein S18 acetylase RimI-like enzyme
VTIAELQPVHVDALSDLLKRLPDSDVTFIKEDASPETVSSWLRAPGWRWVEVVEDGTVAGLATLIPLTGWSDHVAELRLAVDPATRGQGIGRGLAQKAVAQALRARLLKVIVELPSAQDRTIEMFLELGFTGEALLRDQFRDRNGDMQDLIMLAYLAEQAHESLTAIGVADVFGGQ